MHTHSLFTLLGERLMLHTNTVTLTTYNTLYEVSAASSCKLLNVISVHTVRVCVCVFVYVTLSLPTAPLTAPDPDGAGVHAGRPQAPPGSRLLRQDPEPQ